MLGCPWSNAPVITIDLPNYCSLFQTHAPIICFNSTSPFDYSKAFVHLSTISPRFSYRWNRFSCWTLLLIVLSFSVEPGVWLGLEGAHCQVLFACGLHIWLPSDGCHGWLVCCLFHSSLWTYIQGLKTFIWGFAEMRALTHARQS